MSMTAEQFDNKLIEVAKKKGIPLWGKFELTGRCNLKCKMCYVRKEARDKEIIKLERTAAEWIKLAEEAKAEGLLYLLFTGGEVFLRPDFKEIYEAVSLMGFSISIYTNATLITAEIANWLGKIPPSLIEVTLYGASPETYEEVTGDFNAYDKAVMGIDLLKAEGINIQIRTTVVKSNKADIFKIIEFAEHRDIQFGIVDYISPRRDGTDNCLGEERLTPEEVMALNINLENYYRNKSDEILKEAISDEKDDLNGKPSDNDTPFPCGGGNCWFWVTWDGRMTPCGLMEDLATFPFNIGLEKAWKDLKKKSLSIPRCRECTNCDLKEFCLTCPARLKNETGYYDRPAPYLCSLAEKLRDNLS